MKRIIYKYKIKEQSVTEIELPISHRVLTVGMQGSDAYVWIELDPNADKYLFEFHVHVTGFEYDATDLEFIGTFYPSPFIFHLFKKQLT